MAELERVDGMEGAITAIERGYVQAQIRESAYRQQTESERRTRRIVGVNLFKENTAQEIAPIE